MEIQMYKKQLEELLGELTEELKSVGVNDPKNKSDWEAFPDGVDVKQSDPNDVADSVEDWNANRALVATLETRYNNLVSALTRIDDGSYGMCAICKNEIEGDRLHANPASETCKTHIEEPIV